MNNFRETTPLTINNFSFMRRPVGAEEGEIFRSASAQRGRSAAAAAARKRGEILEDSPKLGRPKKRKPEIVIERDSDDVNVNSLLALANESPILTSRLMTPVTSHVPTSVVVTPVTVRSASGTPVRTITPVRVLTPVRILTPVSNALPVSSTPLPGEAQMETSGPNAEIGRSGNEEEGTGKDGEKLEMMFPSSEAVIISPPKKKFKATARKSTTHRIFRKPKPK